jgi:2'-hydroxyisoflavone reductase
VHTLVLDRLHGHESLAVGEWDAVIDVSGYVPAVVRDAIGHLARDGRPYVYISSCSVYTENERYERDERTPLVEFADEDLRQRALTDVAFDWREHGVYGECKVLCERELTVAWPGPVALLRPVIIAGRYDSTWRVGYWVDRAARGGDILAPKPRSKTVGMVDAQDLAVFAVRCAERSIAGAFNIAADPATTTFEAFLDAAIATADTPGEAVWVDSEFLETAGVEPHGELPFWLPESTGSGGAFHMDTSAAKDAGFTTRPLLDTMRDLHRWLEVTPDDQLPDPGITMKPQREAELLAQFAGG